MCTESEWHIFSSVESLKVKLCVCPSYLLLSRLKAFWCNINSVLTRPPHLPQVNFPDRSSPLNKYSPSALLAATFFLFLFLFPPQVCYLAVEEEAELERTSSLEAIFSGTELPKPCNLFIMVCVCDGFHVSSQKCVHVGVIVVPLFTLILHLWWDCHFFLEI